MEARRAEEEEARRARERAAAEERAREQERVRVELERAQEEKRSRIEHVLVIEIDFYIRTRRAFDSRSPMDYKCSAASILQSADVREALELYNDYYDPGYTLLEFISEKPDRFVFSLVGELVGVKCLTPFQGGNRHRVFGYFKCGGCQRFWKSAATWKNKWQQCQKCDRKCYPYQQHPLLNSGESEGEDAETRRPHDMSRCQKCQELGEICVPHIYYSM
ncbi:hypothetical protein EON65_46355 [archaeon]|nr:MAG: hypothetical protein EON65_46355 [archaeon]